MHKYDVVVVGGGHAGCEAAAAAARLGANTLLITHKISTIGEMSCNPAIGGVAKGVVVREVDALDGIMGRAIDQASIHSVILNSSRGAAVWGPRAQADRKLYKQAIQEIILNYNNLTVKEESVDDFLIESNNNGELCIKAVITSSGEHILTSKVVLKLRMKYKNVRGYSNLLLELHISHSVGLSMLHSVSLSKIFATPPTLYVCYKFPYPDQLWLESGKYTDTNLKKSLFSMNNFLFSKYFILRS